MRGTQTVQIVTGVGGSGKSFGRVKYLIDEFIPDYNGKIITNLPLNADYIAKHFEKLGFDYSSIFNRIEIIPDEVQTSWHEQKSGPWDYFSDRDLTDCFVIIDEIHELVNKRSHRDHIDKWAKYLGTFRHEGAVCELMTQTLTDVPPPVQQRAGKRLNYVPAGDRRDPLFKITMEDWYQFRSKITKNEHKVIFCKELTLNDNRWSVSHYEKFKIDKFYYPFYDSYNVTVSMKGGEGGKGKTAEWKRLSWPRFLRWFFKRNLPEFARPLGVILLIIFICWFRPDRYFMDKFKKETGISKEPQLAKSSDPKKMEENLKFAKKLENRNDQVKITYDDAELKELRAKELALKEAQLKHEKQLEDERKKKEITLSSKLVFITQKYAILRNKIKLEIGDELSFEPFKGRIVTDFDFDNRRVVLDDQTFITFE